MRRNNLTAAALSLAALTAMMALTGCNGDKQSEMTLTEIEPGLSYVDSLVGSGDVVGADDFILAHYTGWVYTDGQKGEKFDSSHDRGEPIAFPLGRSFVIPGWEKGVPGMKVGGKRTLVIGHELAYGEQGRPPQIPPSATLMFDIEVVDLPKVEVQIQEQGTGAVAEVGDQVSVHYTGWLWENGATGTEFDSSHGRGVPYRFTLGARMVIPGWDQGLTGMKVGTKARLIIPPVMGYGKRGSGPNIPPNSTLCFDVELMEIQGK